MILIEQFVFNPLQVNTYVLYNGSGDCIIVDPACMEPAEQQGLTGFIEQKGLTPVMLINTHGHVDHVVGNQFIYTTYGLTPVIHKEGLPILQSAPEQGEVMGFPPVKSPAPESWLEEGQTIELGQNKLEVRYTPGHADGSICLVAHKEGFVITGDLLFAGSVGRADLPTGNMDQLIESIREKILSLPQNFTVYPGHGPATTVGEEKANNPFF